MSVCLSNKCTWGSYTLVVGAYYLESLSTHGTDIQELKHFYKGTATEGKDRDAVCGITIETLADMIKFALT